MPDQDDYGQGILVGNLDDAPDYGKLAHDLADGLVPRSVLRYQSASTRNATVTSPQAGMMAWLETERQLTHYDGTAWVVLSAGTSSWTTIPLASGFAPNGNSNGTPQYRVVNEFGERTLQLRGAVSVTYSGTQIPNNAVVNTTALPENARPGSLRTITIPCSDVNSFRITLKLDIQPQGWLKIYGTGSGSEGTATPTWIGFNGCYVSL